MRGLAAVMPVRPVCPRCGYDLDGLISTWLESCPLRSMCSECGLDFECSRALSPRVIGPRWSYEHGFTRQVRRWWASSLVALVPWKMFRELGVDHRINAQRLVWFAAWWLLAIHLASSAVTLGFAYIAGQLNPPVFRGSANLLDYLFHVDVASHLICPYFESIAIPAGPGSSIHIPLAPLYILVLVPTFCSSGWMLFLGSSLHLARVRKLQLLRGFAFSLPCAAAYLAVLLAVITLIPTLGGFAGIKIPPVTLGGVMLVCLLHHWAWWYLFIRRYLRLRHAAAVVALHSVMNGLVLVIVLVVLSNSGMRF